MTRRLRLLLLLLAALLAPAAHAQTWERLPSVLPAFDSQVIRSMAFLRGEGEAAGDPAADSLLIGKSSRLFIYNPSGCDGAAGCNSNGHTPPNDTYGAWHNLCLDAQCVIDDLVVTAANSVLLGARSRPLSHSTDRGRTRVRDDSVEVHPVFESALPALVGPNGERGLVGITSDAGHSRISREGGVPGSWVRAGLGHGMVEVLGEVPPSPALPTGRILMGVWNGVTGSTDGGQTYEPTSLYLFGGYIARSFTFVTLDGHPYGGAAFAAVINTALQPFEMVELYRSDDGGQVWSVVHRFTGEETGLPLMTDAGGSGYLIGGAQLLATPGGVLYASVDYTAGSVTPGVIMRSDDLGVTWTRADAGYTGYVPRPGSSYPPSTPDQPYGWRVRELIQARDGRIYAATDNGVWRTTEPVVSSDAWPTPASSGLMITARPNPSSGTVTLSLSSEQAERVRVEVVDASGRVVFEAVAVWATPAGAELRLPSEGWASGVYVARASVGRHTEHVTARFTVVR